MSETLAGIDPSTRPGICILRDGKVIHAAGDSVTGKGGAHGFTTASPTVPLPSNRRFKNLTAKRFGKLTVLRYLGRYSKSTMWHCRCDCGVEKVCYGMSILAGRTKSCGCHGHSGDGRRTHGDTANARGYTAEYNAWLAMKRRCFNEKDKSYGNYGGRGITVCDRWRFGESGQSGFECFLADMGRRPSPEHSIDRYPDNDGNYEPGNCRWATQAMQQRNRRDTTIVDTCRGPMALRDACEMLGLNYQSTRSRMHRGWSWERASTEPKHWRGVPRG